MCHTECSGLLVDPYVCDTLLVFGFSETDHVIRKSADASDLFREMHSLIGGNGLRLRQAADLRSNGRSVDVLVVGARTVSWRCLVWS